MQRLAQSISVPSGMGVGVGVGVTVTDKKPQVCSQLYAPVCGCDKVKYTNSCFAHAGGTSVWYNSPCE